MKNTKIDPGILKPKLEKSCYFAGVRFYTKNLGAIDPVQKNFVWFAVGQWSHDGMPFSVSSSLIGAIADRFDCHKEIGLYNAESLRTPEQKEKLSLLENEISKLVIS